MARPVLNAAGRALVAEFLVAGETNAQINARLVGAGFPTISDAALSHYRRKHHPETVARDLEAVQAGHARFVERVAALTIACQALLDFAVRDGRISGEKDALFALKVHAETAQTLGGIMESSERRLLEWSRQELEAELGRARLKLEEAAARRAEAAEARAAEKWAIERDLIGREIGLLEKLEAASVSAAEGEG